jgi:NADH-quinone oxidoreductase subunit I
MAGVKKIKPPSLDFPETVKFHLGAFGIALREAVKPSRMTVQYPREIRKRPKGFRGMLVFDINKCISCFQCAFVCPANAIHMKKAPNGKYYPCVDYAKCIFCHYCRDTCTKGAWKTTNFMDVAFKSVDEMLLKTENLVVGPVIPEEEREDEYIVEYNIEGVKLKLKKDVSPDKLIEVED